MWDYWRNVRAAVAAVVVVVVVVDRTTATVADPLEYCSIRPLAAVVDIVVAATVSRNLMYMDYPGLRWIARDYWIP